MFVVLLLSFYIMTTMLLVFFLFFNSTVVGTFLNFCRRMLYEKEETRFKVLDNESDLFQLEGE